MSILRTALASLRATADKAIDFADPARALAEAEDKFKATVADAYQAIEERVAKLEESAVDPLLVMNPDGTVSKVVNSAEAGASDALAEVKDKLHELVSRLEGVEQHPALAIPALVVAPPPAPAASPTGEEIAAAALAAASGQAT